MAKPEWGLKRTCLGCGSRFYDLTHDPIVCPKCGAVFDPLAALKPRRSRAAAAASAQAAAQKAEPVVAAATVEEPPVADTEDAGIEGDDIEDDKDDDVLEDASELGEDEDVSDVVEGVEDGNGEDR